MASIADIEAPAQDRRERLRAIWQPVVHSLVDASPSAPGGEAWNPNYVGCTIDTRRPVFLEKATSPGGLVYRKFVVRRN